MTKSTVSDDEYCNFMDELDELQSNVKTAKDFAKFVERLEYGYQIGLLAQQPLDQYLGSVAETVENIDLIVERYDERPPGPIDWEWVALIFASSFGTPD